MSLRLLDNTEEFINKDPLCMLKLASNATSSPGLAIHPDSANICRVHAHQISKVNKSRIKDEILKALAYPNAGWMFRHMDTLGLLEFVIPDLYRGKGMTQNKYHVDTVLEHLCHCVDQCNGKKYHPLLKLAVLFHDIAKPHTRKVINGEATFYKHEVVGASLAYEWMNEYKFHPTDINYVVKMVRHHQFRFYDDTADKTYRKWLHKVGREDWRDLIRLRMADRKGNRINKNKPALTAEIKQLIKKIHTIFASKEPVVEADLKITGNDLRALGLTPGPVYKTIFTSLLGVTINDPKLNEREWLIRYVQKHYLVNKDKEQT